MPRIYLSVVIPAYNEEKRLSKTLTKIDGYLRLQPTRHPPTEGGPLQNYDYEIIVVNDGSKDRTAEVVREMMPEIKNLKLIDNKENNGKGYVVRQGMLEAEGEYRLFTDADNSTSIDQVEKMWPYFKKVCSEPVEEGYDIVIGSRDIKGAVLAVPQPWPRKVILGGGFKLFRKIIIGLWGIQDTQCGFKGFTKKAAEAIFPKCRIDRFAFDPEILVIAKKLGYKIKEIPITWINAPDSRVKLKSIVKMGLDLFRIRWNLIKGAYDQK